LHSKSVSFALPIFLLAGFAEVRGAAVESMCVLAQSNASYARQTQDFLVDMFNDEIQEVRLQAIRALCKLSHHLSLRDDQVEIITGVLKVNILVIVGLIQ